MQKRISNLISNIRHLLSNTYYLPSTKQGYTIIEVLTVTIIIGILATVAFVAYNGVQNRAVSASLQSDLQNASDQLMANPEISINDYFPNQAIYDAKIADGSIKWSEGTTPTLTINTTNTPNTFCLTATKSNQSYFITQEGLPMPGPCPILYLDAGIVTSYPGTGTTWYDLSGNGNNAALSGDIEFNNSNNGFFIFDGVNDHATITNNSNLNFSSAQTVIIMMKHPSTSIRRNPYNQAYGGYGTWTYEINGKMTYFYGSAGTNTSPYTFIYSPTNPTDTWHMLSSTRDSSNAKWYQNDSLQSTTTNPYGVLTTPTTADIIIGNGYIGRWLGNISIVMAYDKALSASDISKIFDSFRSRYGL